MKSATDQSFREGWKAFEHLICKKLASLKSLNTKNDVAANRYVYDLLEKSLRRLQKSRFSGIVYELFETHRSVIVRVYLPENFEPQSIHLEIAPLHLEIDGLADKKKEKICLPAPVRQKRYDADYQNGVLEITLRKQTAKRKRAKVKTADNSR